MNFPDKQELEQSISRPLAIAAGIVCLLIAIASGVGMALTIFALVVSEVQGSADTSNVDHVLIGGCTFFSALICLFMGTMAARMLWPKRLGKGAMRLSGLLFIGTGILFLLMSLIALIFGVFVADEVRPNAMAGLPIMFMLALAAIRLGKAQASLPDDEADTSPKKFGPPE
jgi:hypothetical protein